MTAQLTSMTRSTPSIDPSPPVPSPLTPLILSLAEAASSCVMRFFSTSLASSESSFPRADERTFSEGSYSVTGVRA